jgi:hypothetical protein
MSAAIEADVHWAVTTAEATLAGDDFSAAYAAVVLRCGFAFYHVPNIQTTAGTQGSRVRIPDHPER